LVPAEDHDASTAVVRLVRLTSEVSGSV